MLHELATRATIKSSYFAMETIPTILDFYALRILSEVTLEYRSDKSIKTYFLGHRRFKKKKKKSKIWLTVSTTLNKPTAFFWKKKL